MLAPFDMARFDIHKQNLDTALLAAGIQEIKLLLSSASNLRTMATPGTAPAFPPSTSRPPLLAVVHLLSRPRLELAQFADMFHHDRQWRLNVFSNRAIKADFNKKSPAFKKENPGLRLFTGRTASRVLTGKQPEN